MNQDCHNQFELLDNTCKHKFRTRDDVNEWLFRHWQIMTGNFEPRRWDFGLLMRAADVEAVVETLRNPGRLKMLCINDSNVVEEYEKCKKEINKALEQRFPEKSMFEI